MKIAIVHEWFAMGGAEQVLLSLHRMFPEAPIYASVCDEKNLFPGLRDADIRCTFLQRFPLAKKMHKKLLPLYPLAYENLDLREFDLVISINHCCAKGVITRPDAVHICYCCTPMRYAWDLKHEYLENEVPRVFRPFASGVLSVMRIWDESSARRVDHFVAISSFIAQRIKKYYGRESAIIYPPVDIAFFNGVHRQGPGDYYLVVSRLVKYKKIDLVIRAFNELGASLIIAGDGPERARLEALARPNVRFVGRVSREGLRDLYSGARALVFAAEEDFGIVPVEAQAAGCPVIAYGRGGALDTVEPDVTGVFFREQSVESIKTGVTHFESVDFNPRTILEKAQRFGETRFINEILQYIAASTSSSGPSLAQHIVIGQTTQNPDYRVRSGRTASKG